MRTSLLALSLLLAAPARAADAGGGLGLTVTADLGGGAEIGSSGSTGIGELELGGGWELGEVVPGFAVRPELALLVGLAPGTYLGVRPGVHLGLPLGPLYARAALDWAHAHGEWRQRWLLLGGGAELRLTSVLGGFVEADAGVPLAGDSGVGVLGRAGFAFRF